MHVSCFVFTVILKVSYVIIKWSNSTVWVKYHMCIVQFFIKNKQLGIGIKVHESSIFILTCLEIGRRWGIGVETHLWLEGKICNSPFIWFREEFHCHYDDDCTKSYTLYKLCLGWGGEGGGEGGYSVFTLSFCPSLRAHQRVHRGLVFRWL